MSQHPQVAAPEIEEYVGQNIRKTYGKKTKDRNLEPTMYHIDYLSGELLKWNDGENLKNDFTKDHLQNNPILRYGSKIKKSSSPWISEQQESYQPFTRIDNRTVVFPVDVTTLKKIYEDEKEGRTAVTMVHYPPENEPHLLDLQKQGVSNSDYGLRRVKSEQQLRKILEENCPKKHIERPKFTNILYVDADGKASSSHIQDQQKKKEEGRHTDSHHEYDKRNKSDRLISKRSKPKKLSQQRVVYIDPVNEKESPLLEQRLKKIKKFKDTSRWIPDTSFMTYFGKPPFSNYGRGNVKPTSGGVVYGQYLLSHNVSPHRGSNSPKFIQSYVPALNAAESLGTIYPEPPRLRAEENMTDEQVQARIKFNPIYAQQNKINIELPIQKPDLINSYVFSENPNPEIFQDKSTHKIQKKTVRKMTLQQILKSKANKKLEDTQEQTRESKIIPKEMAKTAHFAEDQKIVHVYDTTPEVYPESTTVIKGHKKNKIKEKPVEETLSFFPERQNGFMSEVKRKKEKDSRLALKVTEVVCVKDSSTKNIDTKPSQCHLDYIYHDPRCYKNVSPEWLTRIPAAGKALQRNCSAKELV